MGAHNGDPSLDSANMDTGGAEEGAAEGEDNLSGQNQTMATLTGVAQTDTEEHISNDMQLAIWNQGFVVEELGSDCTKPTGGHSRQP